MNTGENGPQSAVLRSDRLGMDKAAMLRLKRMHLAPYIQLATLLIGKPRRSGGNMFRHQLDTMAILMDYGYIDSVLLKASLIHDLLEDAPETDPDSILSIDDEAVDVYKLVLGGDEAACRKQSGIFDAHSRLRIAARQGTQERGPHFEHDQPRLRDG